MESFGNSVDLLSKDTQTLQLVLLDSDLSILDVSQATDMFSIIVPRKSPDDADNLSNQDNIDDIDSETIKSKTNTAEADFIIPEIKFYENMVYHQFLVNKAYSAVNIEITPTNSKSELLLFFNYKYKPLIDHNEMSIPLKRMDKSASSSTYNIFLDNSIINNRTGFFYLGITSVNVSRILSSEYAYLLHKTIQNDHIYKSSLNISFTSSSSSSSLNNNNIDDNIMNNGNTSNNIQFDWINRDFDTNYSIKIYTSGCYFFDYNQRIWSGEGCYVANANTAMTHCKCNHLTSFGSGFFVAPNLIDFNYVFANAGFVDNITIYMTVVITLTIYVILLIWARNADRESIKKLGATPLPDNISKDKYLYEIQVFTGDRDAAATDSRVNFILSGDDDETDVRCLQDPNRKLFRRGAQDIFVMAVARKLGRLTYMRIWHDNSGKGKFRSWFLSFLVIKDVQTGEKYEFICNKWLAVEKGK